MSDESDTNVELKEEHSSPQPLQEEDKSTEIPHIQTESKDNVNVKYTKEKEEDPRPQSPDEPTDEPVDEIPDQNVQEASNEEVEYHIISVYVVRLISCLETYRYAEIFFSLFLYFL